VAVEVEGDGEAEMGTRRGDGEGGASGRSRCLPHRRRREEDSRRRESGVSAASRSSRRRMLCVPAVRGDKVPRFFHVPIAWFLFFYSM